MSYKDKIFVSKEKEATVTLISKSKEVLVALESLLPEAISMVFSIQVTRDRKDSVKNYELIYESGLVILDLSDVGLDWQRVLRSVLTMAEGRPVIVLDIYSQMILAKRVIESGAAAYLPVNTCQSELEEAIRRAFEGKTYISDRVA